MAQLLADEDIYTELVERLRSLGHNVLWVVDLPSRSGPDHLWMIRASESERVILTHNWRHYLMLHHAWLDWAAHWNVNPLPRHPGILCVPQKDLLSSHRTASQTDDILSEDRNLANSYHRLLPNLGWISR